METTDALNWDYDGPVVRIEGLEKHFPQSTGLVHQLLGSGTNYVKAVNGVDLRIDVGETVGLVGESGCGKSTLGEVVVGLQEPTAGRIEFLGQDVTAMTDDQRREFRRNVQMIFQDPYESLNPRFTVDRWVREPLEIHDVDDQDERVVQALRRAELEPPEQFLDQHPHELSGGQRQRVSIARALVLEPKFIVADEPVSMLDVSVRASILELLESLVQDLDMAALYISHDLSLIRQMCDRVNVMYLGEIAESGPTEAIVQSPKHPYARALLDAVPVPDPSKEIAEPGLAGEPPDPVDLPTGCNFRPRCPFAGEECFEQPAADEWSQGAQRRAACFRVDAVAENPAAVESSSQDVPGEAESGD